MREKRYADILKEKLGLIIKRPKYPNKCPECGGKNMGIVDAGDWRWGCLNLKECGYVGDEIQIKWIYVKTHR